MTFWVVWAAGFTAALALMAVVFAARRVPVDADHIIAALVLAIAWPLLFLALAYVLWLNDHE
jgi:ABC-type Fe3+ transport system permease subunit